MPAIESVEALKNQYVGASKHRGTPKWMVYNEKPIKIHDLGVPLFLETPM